MSPIRIVQAPAWVLSNPVEEIDVVSVSEKSINMIYKYMTAILSSTSAGIALAANQAGFTISMFVHRFNVGATFTGIINPSYTIPAGVRPTKIENAEACLSLSEEIYRDDIKRYPAILASYWEYPSKVQIINRYIEGFEAQMFQHEIDHLRGYTIETRPELI